MFLPYAALFAALAPLLARHNSQTFLARTGSGFAAYLAATLLEYLYIRLVANPGLPHISWVGLARFGLVMGSGVLMAAAVAFLSDNSGHRTTEPAA
jgi:hypothetical protein